MAQPPSVEEWLLEQDPQLAAEMPLRETRPGLRRDRQRLGRTPLLRPCVHLPDHSGRRRPGPHRVAEDVDARQIEAPQERGGTVPGRVVLAGEAGDHVRVDGRSGDRPPHPRHEIRVERGIVAAPHPPQDRVVARLQRNMEVGQAAPAGTDPDVEQLVGDVLRLDAAEPDPLDLRLGEDAPHQARQRQAAAVVRAGVDAGQHDLAVGGRRRAPHLRDHLVGCYRSLGAASPGNDAVGAMERAAVLDLHEGARSIDVGPTVEGVLDRILVGLGLERPAQARLERRFDRQLDPRKRRHRPAVREPEQACQLGHQAALRFVVIQAGQRIGRGQRPRIDRDGAAGDEDPSVGASPPGASHGLARLAVGDRGHGAGVDHDQIGGGAPVHQLHAALAEQPLDGVHLRLVHLAAEVGDRGAANGAWGGGALVHGQIVPRRRGAPTDGLPDPAPLRAPARLPRGRPNLLRPTGGPS